MKSPTFPEISYADWRRDVEAELGENGFEDALLGHADGVDFEALCTAEHPVRSAASAVAADLPAASEDGLNWIPCQQFDHSDPEKLNHHLKSDLANGVAGIWLRLDRTARQREDPATSKSIGAGGAPIYRMTDIATAFEGTQASWHTLLLDSGGSFLPAAAMVSGWLQREGVDLEGRTLLLGADPLGTLARDGSLPASLEALMDDVGLLIRHSQDRGPRCRALAISTQPYREAGAEIDQELAVGLSAGAEYLRWMEKRGLEPEIVAAELALITSTGQQVFLEIAKLRALRALWSQLFRACGMSSPPSPWIHAAVLRRNLPSREPSINLMRGTVASLAAIVGGAESVETPAYDWFDGLESSERGRRLARNTQMILGLEAHLGRVMDPGSGSYFLETVTRELVVRAWDLFRVIERRGGLFECLASGWLHETVDARWRERCREVEQSELPLTGVNTYTEPGTSLQEIHDGSDLAVQASIRRRYAQQEKGLGPGDGLDLSSSENRWHACLQSALEDRSIAEMGAALYAGDPGPVVRAFPPRRDSEPCEPEAGES